MNQALDKRQAQARSDRIRAFREELRALEAEGVLVLSDDDRRQIELHHHQLLEGYAQQFDVDVSAEQKQLSLGMRLASLFGAAAFAAAVYFLCLRIWGHLGLAPQLILLAGAPLLGLVAVDFAARREKTLYFAGLLAVLALTLFGFDLGIMGWTFNLLPSCWAFLAWGSVALTVGFGYGLRLPLAAGLLAVVFWSGAILYSALGFWWVEAVTAPELFFPALLIIFFLPSFVPMKARNDFPPIFRLIGLAGLAGFLIALANAGSVSLLPGSDDFHEISYQIVGFLAAGGFIVLGLKRRWAETTYAASVFFLVLLVNKFADWFWESLPKYIFFTILGLVMLGWLLLLRRFRGRLQEAGE